MTDHTEHIAQKVLETIPLVMRTVAAEMRQPVHSFSPAHFQLLWSLHHEATSLSKLAERQSVSLPTMSNSVTILEERGWAKRTRSPKDRRKVIIEITDEGRAMLQDVHQQSVLRVTQILDGLSDEELDKIEAGLLVLRNAFIEALNPEYCPKTHRFNQSED